MTASAHPNLAVLVPGQSATIVGFSDEFLSEKLMEMGVLPGSEVRMEQRAPLGDPLLISVQGTMLSLRKAEAACISVTEIVAE